MWRKVIRIILKTVLGIIGSLLLLLVVLILLIRLPSVQTYITHKATAYISGKTHTKVQLDKVYISFPKSIVLERLYAEDIRHDTLLYLGKLKVDIDMLALMKHTVKVNNLELTAVNANIIRNEVDSNFNFSFLIRAFSSDKKTAPKVKTGSKDTVGWQIEVNKLKLEHIHGSYTDGVSGLSIDGSIGSLDLNMRDIDIRHLTFSGHDLSLADATVTLTQSKSNNSVADSTVSLLPLLALDKINLKNIHFKYDNIPHGQTYTIHVGSLFVLPGAIDLNGHSIHVKRVDLSASDGQITLMRDTSTRVDVASIRDTAYKGWQISGDTVSLHHIDFSYGLSNVAKQDHGVDFNHIDVKDVNVEAGKISYSPAEIIAIVHNISLKEQSGFVLKNLSTRGRYDDKGASLQNLTLTTANSQISRSNISISYPSIRALSKDIGQLGIRADLQPLHISTQDIYYFAPQLRGKLPSVDGDMISVSGKVAGKLNDITATNLLASAGATSVSLDGHITGILHPLDAVYDVQLKDVSSTKNDIISLLRNQLPSSIDIPTTFSVSGDVKGSIANANAALLLKSSSGDISVDATLRMAAGDTQYAIKLNTTSLDLGHILKQRDLGTVTAKIDLKGTGFSPANIVSDMSAEIDDITFRRYTYHHIAVDACADHGAYDADISVKDTNALIDIQSAFSLETQDIRVALAMDVKGIDLQKTKLLDQDIRMGAHANIALRDSNGQLNGKAGISNITIIKAKETYKVDSINMTAVSDTDHAHLFIQSDLLTADYQGTSRVKDLSKAITRTVSDYFTLSTAIKDTTVITTGQNFKLSVDLLPHPLITEVLLPQMKNFNGASLTADFDNDKRKLNLDLSASALGYGGVRADDIQVGVHTINDSLKYTASLDDLTAGPVRLTQTHLSGSVKDNRVVFLLNVKDSTGGDKLLMAGNVKEAEPKSYALHLEEKNFILGNTHWELPQDNLIKYAPEGLNIHQFVLTSGDQDLSIISEAENANAPIKIDFKNFELGTLSQIIESDTALIRGYMNGTVELKNLATAPAFTSDLHIDSIYYQRHAVGDISLKANNLNEDKYEAHLNLSGAGNDVEVNGAYIAAKGANTISLKADIKKLNLQSVEPFTAGQIRRSKGYIAGTAGITGTIEHPLIDGDIGFRDAAFNVAYINNYLTIKDDHIKVDGQGIYLHSFGILDSLGQKATIDGSIRTTDFRKMKFDLAIQTDNFTVLNTTIYDNPLYFGKVLVSSKIKVTGDESLPIVKADIKLLDATNVSVIIPSSKISVDRGDGIVVMVDHSDTTGILGKKKDSVSTQLQFKGLDISANIDIAKKVSFKVIVDKISGDSLVVRGEGRLSFSLDPSGNQNLTGTYTLSGGSYNASFEKVIHKDFTIKDGGSITWNGRPEDAVLDVSAVYAVKSAPADLLSSELSGMSESERAGYSKPLGFTVNLNIKGELLKPELTFKLDMDDKDKAAFGGLVYSKITSVNDDPQELNSQVFSLLILGKFMPSGSGTGSTDYGSMATDLARNSVNQILTDQLNKLSGKYIKGVDLNFGLQSNDEYTQTGVQQNTQVSIGLKKNFFKDRLGVQVGTSINVPNSNNSASQYSASNITGDILLDYKLTPDGRFHFKAFRLNQYEGLIDGLLYKTGVSVLYNRDFNTLHELFSKPVKKDEPKSKNKKVE